MMPTMRMPAAGRTLGVTALLVGLGAGQMRSQRPVPVPIEGSKPIAGQPRVPIVMPVVPPPAGVTVSGTSALARVTWGVNTWTVGAFFLPGPVSTPAANFTKGSLNIPAPKRP